MFALAGVLSTVLMPCELGPAQDAITHKKQVMLALEGRSKYHGPPDDDVDAAWEALYERT